MKNKSAAEVKEEVDRRLREIAMLKEEAHQKGLVFVSLTEEQLAKKIRGESSNSPYIYAAGFTSATFPGQPSTNYNAWISNPDPAGYYPMFLSMFFGAANFVDDVGEALGGRDGRWPYMTTAPFSLAAGGTTNQSFTYTTPTGLPLGTYIGNVVLWSGAYFDKGVVFDRGFFFITLI